MQESFVGLDHPRFRYAAVEVFTRRLVADCMSHRCALVDTHVERLDACCRHGCDVDLDERAAILARGDEVRALLRPEVASIPWFEPEIESDPDYPSGAFARTSVVDDGCIFLAHDRRGCAIHRAALANNWDIHGVKPGVCRLFPLTYVTDAIVIADEYPEYSCARVDGPTLYRLTRDTLGDLFGERLVRAMDAAESRVLAGEPKRLRVV